MRAWFERSIFWPAAIGGAVGLIDLIDLLWSGFDSRTADLLVTVLAYALVGAMLGLVGATAATLVARLSGAGVFGDQTDAADVKGHGLRALLPSVSAAFGLLLLEMLGRSLPPLLASRRTQLLSGALLVAVIVLAWLWSRLIMGSPRASAIRRAFLVSMVLGAGLVTWSGVRPTVARSRPSGPSVSSSGKPDVVLIVVDTLRADHLGVYGYSRPTSPFLDRLAGEGVVFTSAYATSNWTRPSVASLFTSTMPAEHGVTRVSRRVPGSMPLLSESFSRAGYRVGMFSGNANVHPEDGYDRGADHFESRQRALFERTTLGNALAELRFRIAPHTEGGLAARKRTQVDPDELATQALGWIDSVPQETAYFLYLHFMGPHDPYVPPPDIAIELTGLRPTVEGAVPPQQWAGRQAVTDDVRARIVAQYDSEILWHDRAIGALVAGLKEAGRLEGTWLVVTSDHGEGFGEHGVWTHMRGLFQEILRIPLIFWHSGRSVGVSVDSPASLLDVAPTLLDLTGVPVPDTFRGRSLAGSLRGDEPGEERPVLFENPEKGELGVIASGWYYIRGTIGRERSPYRWLFRADDAEQLRPEKPEDHEAVRTLDGLLDGHLLTTVSRSRAEDLEISEERLEALRALGYVD